uniref:WIR1 protein n=1 Tax=Triticum aestivum TaxID=4565 RepID=Q41581_WHEAT|nr:WIR1 [Triticum aestivum]
MASAGRRPTVLMQIALFFVVAAVIMNSSVCLGAAADATAGSGAFDPNRPAVPSTGGAGKPYTGRRCLPKYRCYPPAGGQP